MKQRAACAALFLRPFTEGVDQLSEFLLPFDRGAGSRLRPRLHRQDGTKADFRQGSICPRFMSRSRVVQVRHLLPSMAAISELASQSTNIDSNLRLVGENRLYAGHCTAVLGST